MDQTQLQQNIAKYYAKLPAELQQVFLSLTWMEDLKNICTKYSLSEDQTETLATETTLVLLGIVHLEDYVLTLKKELKLNEETFNKILDDLDSGILKNIKDGLVNTFELNVEFLNNENSNKEDDQVPLPPYAQTITSENTTSSVEQVVSSKGIEDNNKEQVVSNKVNESNIQKVVSEQKEEVTPNINVFEKKLLHPTASVHTVSDYSVKKTDPYRETF